jgi:phage tail-like protein
MASFTKNVHRIDPYKNFKFILKFADNPAAIAAVSKVSPLKRTTEVVMHNDGGDLSTERKSPGRTKFEAITCNLVYSVQGDAAVSLKNYKKDLIIELFNEARQKVKAYNVFRCWVSEYTALPELDANANATAIETIVIQNEGWERDPDVTEPEER